MFMKSKIQREIRMQMIISWFTACEITKMIGNPELLSTLLIGFYGEMFLVSVNKYFLERLFGSRVQTKTVTLTEDETQKYIM